MNSFWADIIRYLAFGQAFIVIILTSVIVARYSFKLSITKARDRAMPWHIVLIGISYIGLTLFAVFDLRNFIGQILTWRAPTVLFLFSCGDAAFIFMLMHLSVQRVLVAAVVDKMALKLTEDLEQLKKVTSIAAEKADTAAHKAEVAAETVQQTHEAVSEIKKQLDGNT